MQNENDSAERQPAGDLPAIVKRLDELYAEMVRARELIERNALEEPAVKNYLAACEKFGSEIANAWPKISAALSSVKECPNCAKLRAAMDQIDAQQGRAMLAGDIDCDSPEKCRAAGKCLSVERSGGTSVQKIVRAALASLSEKEKS